LDSLRGTFEQIAEGKLDSWPRAYFTGADGEGRLREVFELICEREQVALKDIGAKLMKKYRLVSTLANYFKGSVNAAITRLWPDRFAAWELASVPRGYWMGEQGRENTVAAIRWLSHKLNVKFQHLVTEDYIENGLAGMLTVVFDGSAPAAVEFMTKEEAKMREKEAKQVVYPETEERLIFPESEQSMTTTEVAKRLSVHPSYIRKEITTGKLPAVDLNFGSGRSPRYRISEQDLQTYLSERRVPRTKRNTQSSSES